MDLAQILQDMLCHVTKLFPISIFYSTFWNICNYTPAARCYVTKTYEIRLYLFLFKFSHNSPLNSFKKLPTSEGRPNFMAKDTRDPLDSYIHRIYVKSAIGMFKAFSDGSGCYKFCKSNVLGYI